MAQARAYSFGDLEPEPQAPPGQHDGLVRLGLFGLSLGWLQASGRALHITSGIPRIVFDASLCSHIEHVHEVKQCHDVSAMTARYEAIELSLGVKNIIQYYIQ